MAERRETDEAPSGIPDGGDEITPMGPADAEPDGEGETPRGDDAQPGIPDEGEADIAG